MMRCFLVDTTPRPMPPILYGPRAPRQVHGEVWLMNIRDYGISWVLWLDDEDPQQAEEIAWIGKTMKELTSPLDTSAPTVTSRPRQRKPKEL